MYAGRWNRRWSCSGLVGSYHIVYNQNIADQLRVYEGKCRCSDRNVLETNADLTCTFFREQVYGVRLRDYVL